MHTQSKRSVTSTPPTLPPEIWDCIFHHATYVPGTLIPDIYEQFSLIGTLYTRKYHPAIREALLTKRCLVRVCKQWWHLATPYLYQSIYIGRARCLASLCSTLMHSAAGKGTFEGTRRPLGACAQRLDVAIRDHAVYPEAEFDSLARVIACLPNLTIVSFAPTSTYCGFGIPDSILDALQCSASSLRVLDWTNNPLEPSTRSLAELLSKCEQLRILNCPRLQWSKATQKPTIPTVVTLRLHSLDSPPSPVPNEHDVQTSENIPTALRELSFDTHGNLDHWRDFIYYYGSRLTSIQLHIPCTHCVITDRYLQLITGACPNLRRITLSLDQLSCLAHCNLLLPPVEYFGVRASNFQSRKADYQNLFTLLGELKTTTPSLRVVQLTEPHNVNCLLKSHPKLATRAIKQLLEGNPFRIEDQDGNLLEGPYSLCQFFPGAG
ncbi:hypothetical protein BU15DRAFT_47100 [Melanogaster broomeanus]|nr:hypothetical protein BU15DRAFT_47100 [Melanogaster broomeanus]